MTEIDSVTGDPAETLVQAARAGVHRLPIPTPFAVGRINCYLIRDEPLTLVDTGPNSGTSLDELERALREHGARIEDLERVIVTHQHVDHSGLLHIVSRRSGAEVCAFAPLAPRLADYSRSAAEDDAYAQAMMRRHGVPEDLATALGAVAAAFRAYGSAGEVTRALREGDRIAFADRELEVFHRPGHSPSDLVFWDERRAMVIGGDHLLARISSNPLISRPLEGAAMTSAKGRPRPLIDYMNSLRTTREMPSRLVLPGHGDPIIDHAGLITERLRMHDRRARKILRILHDGPMTAHQIAAGIWGNVAVTQAFLTLSEVLGHLDILLAEGAATELEEGDLSRFRAA